ncbi:MAG: pentapeptide repeat-containing protein [Streptosporangiaceae bacterium]
MADIASRPSRPWLYVTGSPALARLLIAAGARPGPPDLAAGTHSRGVTFGRRNLAGASLISANLAMANLSNADLTRANLRGADLTGAKLNGAKLNGAQLNGAKLTGADLTGATVIDGRTDALLTVIGRFAISVDLTGADLTGADLTRANLVQTNLTGANLTDAKLTYAVWSEQTRWPTDDTAAEMLRRSEPLEWGLWRIRGAVARIDPPLVPVG